MNLQKFEHSLLNAYYKNNHLALALKFIKNANNQTLKVLIKAYGLLLNPVWVNAFAIDYPTGQCKENKNVVNDDENICIMNFCSWLKKNNIELKDDSSDILTSNYHFKKEDK